MPQATITVAGITPPAQGKKQGRIIDSEGNKWNVWGDKLQNYRMGVTYNITYEASEFNGAPFNVIKTAEPAGQGVQQSAQPKPILKMTEVASMVERTRDEHIFVCGALNHALGNQNINPLELTPAEILNFIQTLRQAWKQTLGAPKSIGVPRTEQGMDDEIPF